MENRTHSPQRRLARCGAGHLLGGRLGERRCALAGLDPSARSRQARTDAARRVRVGHRLHRGGVGQGYGEGRRSGEEWTALTGGLRRCGGGADGRAPRPAPRASQSNDRTHRLTAASGEALHWVGCGRG